MKKFLIYLGILLHIVLFLYNRLYAPLSDMFNIIVGLMSVSLTTSGLLYGDIKINEQKNTV